MRKTTVKIIKCIVSDIFNKLILVIYAKSNGAKNLKSNICSNIFKQIWSMFKKIDSSWDKHTTFKIFHFLNYFIELHFFYLIETVRSAIVSMILRNSLKLWLGILFSSVSSYKFNFCISHRVKYRNSIFIIFHSTFM